MKEKVFNKKSFINIQKLREFIVTRFALQKTVREVLQAEEKGSTKTYENIKLTGTSKYIVMCRIT
jgi:hypothetical protein